MHDSIIKFFINISQKDANTLKLITHFQGDLLLTQNNNEFIFSLRALHHLLTETHTLSYSDFQKLIYQGNINEALQASGCKIELHKSTGKIDGNLYKLIQI